MVKLESHVALNHKSGDRNPLPPPIDREWSNGRTAVFEAVECGFDAYLPNQFFPAVPDVATPE